MNETIYLDHAATTPVDPRVLEAMLPYFSRSFGNPSSLYRLGRENRKALDECREKVAELLGAESPDEIIFTSGGSESDNLIIKGVALHKKSGHIISSAVEHSAVVRTARSLDKFGFTTNFLPTDEFGRANPLDLEKAVTPETILISVMTANNEVGTIQPIKELAEIASRHKIPFHTDAVQAVGSLKLNVREMGVAALSLSAHKIYGPKGVGALYLREGLRIFPLIHGGEQERRMRAGTENIPGIVGLTKALELADREREDNNKKLTVLRDKLISGILSQIPNCRLTGHPVERLANSASFVFEFVDGEAILLGLDREGICASSGSACASGSVEPSHVLLAMGIPAEIAHGSLRLTLGKDTTPAEIEKVLEVMPGIINRLREMSPLCPLKAGK